MDYGSCGPPSVLHVAESPLPAVPGGSVLIEVAFAGINGADISQRKGMYPPPPGASPILGLEVSGRVTAVAPGVLWPAVGELVCALAPGGGYAEYCAVPADHCLRVPHGLSLRDAASLPETYFTVWANVFDIGRLSAGETFLVHGGSSGIGVTAIQLARAFGARVITTVGSAEKAAFCEGLGADAIVYKAVDFEPEVLRLTNGRGVDVILDMVGGPYVDKHFRLLAHGGRLCQIAFRSGASVTADFSRMVPRRLTWTGSALRPRSNAEKAKIARDLDERVWPLFESGALVAVVHATFPLERAAEAHEMMEGSLHIGKIVLENENYHA
jgi:NADPH2:quinone reductase